MAGEVAEGLADETINHDGVVHLAHNSVPVGLHVVPLLVATERVARQRVGEDVHVGNVDGVAARSDIEQEADDLVLEDLGVLDGTESGENDELAVDGAAAVPLLLENIDVLGGVGSVGETGAVGRAAERGMEGIGIGVLSPGVEALASLGDNPKLVS